MRIQRQNNLRLSALVFLANFSSVSVGMLSECGVYFANSAFNGWYLEPNQTVRVVGNPTQIQQISVSFLRSETTGESNPIKVTIYDSIGLIVTERYEPGKYNTMEDYYLSDDIEEFDPYYYPSNEPNKWGGGVIYLGWRDRLHHEIKIPMAKSFDEYSYATIQNTGYSGLCLAYHYLAEKYDDSSGGGEWALVPFKPLEVQ